MQGNEGLGQMSRKVIVYVWALAKSTTLWIL